MNVDKYNSNEIKAQFSVSMAQLNNFADKLEARQAKQRDEDKQQNKEEHNEIKETMKDNHSEIVGIVKDIKTQTVTTNGKVKKHTAVLSVASAVIGVIVLPVLGYLFIDYIQEKQNDIRVEQKLKYLEHELNQMNENFIDV